MAYFVKIEDCGTFSNPCHQENWQKAVPFCLFSLILHARFPFNLEAAELKFKHQVRSQKETGRCGYEFMNEWMNEKWTVTVQVKCKIEFVLTLTQARGLWGCLGNWLPVQWMGKWVWSQQGFVGRWERRQAIGTQHMPHGGLMLMLWQRCWPSSICWEMRRVATTWHVGSTHIAAFVPRRSWKPTAVCENTTIREHLVEEDSFFVSRCWFLDYCLLWLLCRRS